MITDSVAILHKGKLLRTGTIDELTSESSGYEIKISRTLTMEEENSIVYLEKAGENLYRYNASDPEGLNKIIDKLRVLNVLIHEVILKRSNLEDLFIKTINSGDGGTK